MKPPFIALFVFLTPLAICQTPTGTIRGRVTSALTGESIVHARVSLDNPPYITYTDSSGAYRLVRIRPSVYDLTVSAPGYARLTFKGLMIPEYSPIVIDPKLRSLPSSDSTIVVQFGASMKPPAPSDERMMFYQPDSSIDYKIRIVNPESMNKSRRTPAIPDSSARHKQKEVFNY